MQEQVYKPTQEQQKYQPTKTRAEIKNKLGAPDLDGILEDIGAVVERENLSEKYRQNGGQ